jgi:hypothetical protein
MQDQAPEFLRKRFIRPSKPSLATMVENWSL